MTVRMVVARKTDMGRVRTNNEDALAILDVTTARRLDPATLSEALEVGEKGVLLLLSDGMGGHESGEVASAMVLESMCAAILEGGEATVEARIEAAVRRANTDVAEAAKTQNKKGMGATLTAVLVQRDSAIIAEVGDSRAYLLRGDKLRQITRDQSLVQLLVDTGALSAEEAKTSPQKNVILQAMGLDTDVRVAIGRLELRRFDTILLCCDGLSNALTDEMMREVLASEDPARACAHLIDLANEHGGEDNLTAIVARLEGPGLPASSFASSMTGTFQVLQAFAPKIGEEPKPVPSSDPPASAAPAGAQKGEAPKTPPPSTPLPSTPPTPLPTAEKARSPWVYALAIVAVAIVVWLVVRATGHGH